MADSKVTDNVKDIEEKEIDDIIEFWQRIIDSGKAKIRFTKKSNGEIRIMNCTLDYEKIPKKDQPKNFSMSKMLKSIRSNRIIRVFDLDKQGWRSIPFDNAEWIEDSEKRYKIKPIKK